MTKIVAILGGILASLAALLVGWKKYGEKTADLNTTVKQYKEARRIVERITRPLPTSSALASSARAALAERLRAQTGHDMRPGSSS